MSLLPWLKIYCITPSGRVAVVSHPLSRNVNYARAYHATARTLLNHVGPPYYHTHESARILVRWYTPPAGWRKVAFCFNGRIEDIEF